jgi:phosphate transport system permease protein
MNKFWKSGDLFVWLTGAALMFSLLMIAGLMYLILAKGLGFFWPSDVAELDLQNGSKLMGEIIAQEKVPSKGEGIPDEYRTQLKIGNRDLYGLDFRWVDDEEIESISYPKYAVVLERREWGNMYGFIKEITENRQVISQGNEASWPVLESLMPVYAKIEAEIKAIEKEDIGGINRQIESYRDRKSVV